MPRGMPPCRGFQVLSTPHPAYLVSQGSPRPPGLMRRVSFGNIGGCLFLEGGWRPQQLFSPGAVPTTTLGSQRVKRRIEHCPARMSQLVFSVVRVSPENQQRSFDSFCSMAAGCIWPQVYKNAPLLPWGGDTLPVRGRW